MPKFRASNDELITKFLADPAYLISSDGKIYRNGKEVGRLDYDGYREVWYHGKRLKAHRIVYAKYCGELDALKVVDHKDRDRSNNRPDNLQLITPERNNYYRYRRQEESYGKAKSKETLQESADCERLDAVEV